MSNKNPNEISKLWKNAVDWPCHDGPHTYNGIHADTYINMYYGETSSYNKFQVNKFSISRLRDARDTIAVGQQGQVL